jgi:iron complex outermembrane receptor protein
MKFKSLIVGASMVLSLSALGQTADSVDYYSLSLEELMNIPINSASKKDETLFDAPLSSYTITRGEIDKSGVTSIMEALRLAPGVIVREQTNGVYDIHIRGFDNIQRESETYTKTNTATLVMIDNRPVFNHNLGGTFWETLPIDLNDVDRIEVVRGPSAPLFGPNAVTGVINIITKRVEAGSASLTANVQAGTPGTTIANAWAGKSFGKVSVNVSGNYQKRERFDEKYYLPGAQDYFSLEELNALIPQNPFGGPISSQYPDPSLAMEKYGVNAFITYTVSDAVNFDLSVGTQRSEVHKIFLSNVFNGAIPFTVNKSETSYFNLSGKIHGLDFRTSYLPGHDNLALEATPNQYDFDVYDFAAEYTLGLGKIGSVVPGFSYQNAVYGDEAYFTEGLTFLNGEKTEIGTASGFVRTDLKPADALRIIAAVRVDKFSSHDDPRLAYELATTYKLNKNNLIRAAFTRSNSGSFIGNNFLNLQVPIGGGLTFARTGTENLDLFTVDMIEFGFRSQLSRSLQIDLDVFSQKGSNFTALLTTNGVDPGNGSFQPTEQRFLNVPTTATQTGATLSLNFVASEKLQVKPFVTVQKTRTEDLPSAYIDPDLAALLGAPVTYSNSDHENTPGVYGGYYINFQPVSKLALNLNGYFFGNQRQYDGSDASQTAEAGDIKGKVLANFKVGYQVTPQVSLYLNGRNLFNNRTREFYGADQTAGLYMAGASIKL